MQGVIGNYKFVAVSDHVISIFDVEDEDGLPIGHIKVESGLETEKDFHYEIMDWYSKNAG